VTLSLVNYPTVLLSQDITVVVDGGKTTPKPIICLPSQMLDVMINEEAFLELPPLQAQSSYNVTSYQAFATSFDANVLKVLSTSESDVGTKYLQVGLNS
jgi:hypothetical protein